MSNLNVIAVVISLVVVVLGIACVGLYCLNKSVDEADKT
jgi:hypothetical protein